MVLPIAIWVVDSIKESFKGAEMVAIEQEPCGITNDEVATVIISLDHIRSMKVYMKTLEKWFQELNLHSTLTLYLHCTKG